jgi:hypothetical protein
MKRIFATLALIGLVCLGTGLVPAARAAGQGNDPISNAFKNRRSGILVSGTGRVVRVLPDDTIGSKHQKFILRLPSNQTILIAHNIDLAPRVEPLEAGDTISFRGVYEWNPKGGTVHWTHRDPGGRHVCGWLKKGSKTYK